MKNFIIGIFSLKTLSSFILVSVMILIQVSPSAGFAAGGSDTGWHINPKFMYLIDNTTVGGNATNINRILFDAGVGYKFSGPVYLGGMYGYDNKTTSVSGSSSSEIYQGFGPTFGLMSDNVYFLFTYYLSGTHTSQSGSLTTTYSGISGYQLDFAYLFAIGSSWSLGPALSFRSLHYTTVSPGSSIDYTYTTLLPYVALSISL